MTDVRERVLAVVRQAKLEGVHYRKIFVQVSGAPVSEHDSDDNLPVRVMVQIDDLVRHRFQLSVTRPDLELDVVIEVLFRVEDTSPWQQDDEFGIQFANLAALPVAYPYLRVKVQELCQMVGAPELILGLIVVGEVEPSKVS